MPATRRARCVCGALIATVQGDPDRVQACCCIECQLRSGSAFSYTAFFPEDAVDVSGTYDLYVGRRASGGLHRTGFCPLCGAAVFSLLDALPDLIGIPVGSLVDRAFPPPERLYWACERHHWLPLPEGVPADSF